MWAQVVSSASYMRTEIHNSYVDCQKNRVWNRGNIKNKTPGVGSLIPGALEQRYASAVWFSVDKQRWCRGEPGVISLTDAADEQGPTGANRAGLGIKMRAKDALGRTFSLMCHLTPADSSLRLHLLHWFERCVSKTELLQNKENFPSDTHSSRPEERLRHFSLSDIYSA